MKNELTITNSTEKLKESKQTLTDSIASHYLQAGNVDSGKALSIAKSVVATIKNNSYLMEKVKDNMGSVIDCINQAISIGLTIDANQYCWLIPYNEKKYNKETRETTYETKIQLQIGYKGYIHKINKAFPSSRIQACLVREGDTVEIKKVDNNDVVNHTYKDPFGSKKNDITGAYCIITFQDGKSIVETMNKVDLDLIKSKSKTKGYNGQKTIWEEWYSEMAKKSVVRRACKILFPSELAEINEIDNEQYDLKQPKTQGLDDLNNDNKMKIGSDNEH